jgi:hypothetical protein
MNYQDEERASIHIRDFEKCFDWCILLTWIAGLALCISAWYWSLKHLTLLILG